MVGLFQITYLSTKQVAHIDIMFELVFDHVELYMTTYNSDVIGSIKQVPINYMTLTKPNRVKTNRGN